MLHHSFIYNLFISFPSLFYSLPFPPFLHSPSSSLISSPVLFYFLFSSSRPSVFYFSLSLFTFLSWFLFFIPSSFPLLLLFLPLFFQPFIKPSLIPPPSTLPSFFPLSLYIISSFPSSILYVLFHFSPILSVPLSFLSFSFPSCFLSFFQSFHSFIHCLPLLPALICSIFPLHFLLNLLLYYLCKYFHLPFLILPFISAYHLFSLCHDASQSPLF